MIGALLWWAAGAAMVATLVVPFLPVRRRGQVRPPRAVTPPVRRSNR